MKNGKGGILKEDIFEKVQDHMVLSSGPQRCGSQEFWFGKTCQEEKSRLGRLPGCPKGGNVENTTNDIEMIVKDETTLVEEISEDTNVNIHLAGQQKIPSERVFYICDECGKCLILF